VNIVEYLAAEGRSVRTVAEARRKEEEKKPAAWRENKIPSQKTTQTEIWQGSDELSSLCIGWRFIPFTASFPSSTFARHAVSQHGQKLKHTWSI
jgi:hypothetical protein